MRMGSGWRTYIRHDEEVQEPAIDRALLRRVFAYLRPYAWPTAGMLLTVFLSTLVQLLPPLLIRDLLDVALPAGDGRRVNLLALGLLLVPIVAGLIDVAQRWLSARIGEGIIFSLRQQMYEHL